MKFVAGLGGFGRVTVSIHVLFMAAFYGHGLAGRADTAGNGSGVLRVWREISGG
jgi:hypothetical protein